MKTRQLTDDQITVQADDQNLSNDEMDVDSSPEIKANKGIMITFRAVSKHPHMFSVTLPNNVVVLKEDVADPTEFAENFNKALNASLVNNPFMVYEYTIGPKVIFIEDHLVDQSQ